MIGTFKKIWEFSGEERGNINKFKSATREEQLVLNGVMLGMATQRSITERAG